jgi:hypothetical protein
MIYAFGMREFLRKTSFGDGLKMKGFPFRNEKEVKGFSFILPLVRG